MKRKQTDWKALSQDLYNALNNHVRNGDIVLGHLHPDELADAKERVKASKRVLSSYLYYRYQRPAAQRRAKEAAEG